MNSSFLAFYFIRHLVASRDVSLVDEINSHGNYSAVYQKELAVLG
ncbi:MAG: hypothetical protein Q4Q26_10950 [Eubacteriales bacterium]|nr:hypothetical protein [Eubacteriales bacterium]